MLHSLRRQPGDMRPSFSWRLDGLGALVLLVAIELQVWLGQNPARTAAALAAVALAAALAIRRRRPLAAISIAAGALLGQVLLGASVGKLPLALLAVALLAYSAGAELQRRQALLALALALASGFAGALLGDEALSSAVFGTALFLLLPWSVGRLLRTRRTEEGDARRRAEELDAERERDAAAAVARERVRIARELHDVVAHSVSVMVVQGAAARAVMDADPDRAENALRFAERAGREALIEMRRLVGVLGNSDTLGLAPTPGLAEVERVLKQAMAAGLATELSIQGAPVHLAPALDLCAYRIIQEALTNSIKHSRAGHALVTLRWGEKELEIEIADDGHGPPSGRGEPSGHGIRGMRERVALHAGSFEAGPGPDGGFRVGARFPLTATPALGRT